MKNNRRDFLKRAGLVGIGAASTVLVPACNGKPDQTMEDSEGLTEWTADQEWMEVKYGNWAGPGVPRGPGPMDNVLLRDYAPKSSLVVQETFIPAARFPAIDVHLHHYPARTNANDIGKALADWVKVQEEVGIETSVVLTSATGDKFDDLVELYLKGYPGKFQLYCGLMMDGIAQSDYPQKAVEELERCFENGARGVGELHDKGFGLTRDQKLAPEKRMHHDDPRLDLFWEKCAELNLPVNVHIADHPSAWQPPDVYQERTPVFQRFNQYDQQGLTHGELVDILPRLLDRHPRTKFIACHLANLGHDLKRLGHLLDLHPNLSLDISARDYEVGRQPRAAAKFLLKYGDRVLFGTDMGMEKSMYQSWWRLLESSDEYITGRIWWPYYGLELPDSVLEALYRGNAKQILNWQ